ncbi:AraC family transcriptional regulator [Streptomyces sp. Ru73]|uniref:AraC family transcriptional regulator n=1 Tax=Streptomyces sp. Ru73 TaxID=2080748 RepID=UPI000CDD7451|nr:AraC family transcriptional regulator [Streptomyces sp. Ru73]POX38857.1 AraC family transcriptional regulator [Streptomyces sp. Ru73]
MSADELPLANHQQFHTADIWEARAEVGRAFCPHELRITQRAATLDARLHGAPFERTGLYYLDYGTEVRITPGDLESFFLVQIPLAGHAEITCGREEIISTPELASVPSPTGKLDMRWGGGNPQLIVWFDRASLESHLGSLLGRTVRRPILFSLGMNLTTPDSRSWLNVVDLMRREAEGPGGMTDRPLVMKQFESLLMTQLLMAQPSNYTPALLGEQPRVAPPTVRRAMEVIEGHAAEPLTVAEIAEYVGVGVRALQDGFRRHLDTTPLAYLREVRLDRVRKELLASHPGATTVTTVASRWGFFHPGRFSVAYRQRFGESPSETLRS